MSLLPAFFSKLCGRQSASLIYSFAQQSYLFLICGPQVHLFVDDRFNALDQFDVILRDECYGFPGTTSAGCAANPVYIVFRMCRDIKIDDNVYCRNVETPETFQPSSAILNPAYTWGLPAGHVSRHENIS